MTGTSSPLLCGEEAVGQSGWSGERGQDSQMSPSTSLLLLRHGCPLPADRVLCPTALPWPLAMAQLQVAHHHKSSLPRMVQPPPASVSPPGLELLYKQGGLQHQLRAGDNMSPSPPPCALAWVPLRPSTIKGPLVPRALGAIALARTRLAARPWRCSSPRFNDGQTPPGVPSQGGIQKTSRAWHEANRDGWHHAGSTRV